MQTGKLDQRIALNELTEVNNSGELTQSYVTQETVWAEVISQRGSEAFESARVNARQAIRCRIRYRTDLKTDWRVVWMGDTFNVTAIDYSARRDGMLWFTAEAVSL